MLTIDGVINYEQLKRGMYCGNSPTYEKENIMKLKNNSVAFFAMFLLGISSFMGGCATTGMDRSTKTANSIQEVDKEIRIMIIQIDATATSLDSLVMAGQQDLKKPFNDYKDKLAKLDSEGKRVLKRVDEMKSRSKEYFAEWEKQGDAFTNPEIRELSEQRRSKLAEIYAQVPAAGVGIKGTYHAYMTDLNEIEKYLYNDLTPSGIEAITPVAKKSVQDLNALKASLMPVISALDEIKTELYSGKK